jgi:hypothetical protein
MIQNKKSMAELIAIKKELKNSIGITILLFYFRIKLSLCQIKEKEEKY